MVGSARRRVDPGWLVVATVVYLVVALGLSYAVDARDAFGLRSRMVELGMDHPALWFHLFGEGKLTEMLQWFSLGAGAIIAAAVASRHSVAGARRPARFWGLLSVSLTLMLIEDAGNIRHTIAAYPGDLFEGVSRAPRIVTGVLVLLVIATPALVAFVVYGREALSQVGLRGYLVLALASYAVAATASALSGVADLYERLGGFINERLAHGQLLVMDSPLLEHYGTFEYWLADSVFEEAVELVGATGFLAAGWTALRQESERSTVLERLR